MEKLIAAERPHPCGGARRGAADAAWGLGCLSLEKRPACGTGSQLDLEMDADKGKQRQYSQRMAEPRFNNPYFWPPPPTMPSQLDNLVLINKIKEQLMAEKIRPPHLPPTSVASQQPLLVPPSPAESSQSIMSLPKLQQVPGLHPQAVPQPDVALHARPATSTVTGLGLASRAPPVSTSESSTGTTTPSTPTSTSQSRLIASSPTLISGITSPPLLDSIKTIQGHSLLGAPKTERGRKKIKAENPSGPPVLVVPYPILASGETAKEGKTYRCKVCPLTFFTKSEMQIHSKSHTEAKPHKCPHCSKSFANASYLAQHLRIHLGVKPYHCSYCEKSFRQLSHLQQHTRIHTGDRPYKCPHPGCEKAFTQLSNLQSHQRQHNKDKPYKCPNCYRAYTDSASLQIHLSAHAIKHAKAYCCSMCGRAYTSETYLMKHMSKHTVVEHLVSQHSPQRTESPGIPVRISLI
ncbi:zinc finger protein 362 isoform X1 [Tympanuchus pallidicinctus]|uniref:zinc finger protein 362 isoform X1 n=3 Tax=Tetraoninae TaxID=466585 RepID=UPI0022875FE7|nr:zinc finger protein 362 isoform X1 [Tympanuchus pallidicinctus]